MKRRIAAIAALTLCLAGPLRADAIDQDPLDAWVREHVQAGDIAAAAVANIRGAEVDARGYGHRRPPDGAAPDADTQFQIGSVTKVFTDLLLAEMDASGTLRYASTVGELMPGRFRPRNAQVASITLQALATHTSGLPRLPPNLSMDDPADPYASYGDSELRTGLATVRDKQPLGNFYAYSNFGVGTLGYLLASAAGEGYAASVTRHVIEPLHLQHTGFAPNGDAAVPVSGGVQVKAWRLQDALAGAGALWGSVGDLARLVQAYLGTHEHGLKHELQRDLVIAEAEAGSFSVTRVWHVARAGEHPIYWHNGGTSGFQSFVGFRPDQKRGIAILVSGDADPTGAGLGALGYAPPEAHPAQVDRNILGQYRLTDQFGIGVFDLAGVLVAQASGQSPFAIHAVGDDWYAYGDVDASVHFVRRRGAVVAVEFAQNGVVQKARRVADTAVAAARQEIALDEATLKDYPGAYRFSPDAVLTVRMAAARLEAQLTGQPYFPIYARTKDRFFYKVVDAELQFERDGAGAIEAVVLHQGGVEQRAARAR